MNIRCRFGFLLQLAFLLQPNFAEAAPLCRRLFEQIPVSQNDTVVTLKRKTDFASESRNPKTLWEITDNFGTAISSGRFSFMHSYDNISVFYYGSEFKLVKESVVRLKNSNRLKQEEIPLDEVLPLHAATAENVVFDSIINAGLDSGRKFFTDSLRSSAGGEPKGVFVFVDVNNLGWVNKNFSGLTETGDAYIRAVAKALVKVADRKGLVFRLGGDEFGMVLDLKDPEQIRTVMSSLVKEVKAAAHVIFRNETMLRAAEFRKSYHLYKNGRISESDYSAILAGFKAYVSYSQEGVSIGASRLDGRQPVAIQQAAETQATEMKVVLKKAMHLDVQKYTGENLIYSGPPDVKFEYEIPRLNWDGGVSFKSAMSYQPTQRPDLPLLVKQREVGVSRFANLNIVRYRSETGEPELRAEYFSKPGDFVSEKLEINNHTQFLDARSKASRQVINYFANSPAAGRAAVWINLLNLGKLNYFFESTQTGDKAIARVAEVVRATVRKNDIPFKLAGSEFMLLVDGIEKEHLDRLKIRIEAALNTDTQILNLFDRQLEHLRNLQSAATEPEAKRAIELTINEVSRLRSGTKVTVKAKDFADSEVLDAEALIEHFRR